MLYVTFMLPLKINTFSLGNAINIRNAAIKNQLQYFFPLVRKHTPLDSVSDGAREAVFGGCAYLSERYTTGVGKSLFFIS